MNQFLIWALLGASTLVTAQQLPKHEPLDSVFIDTKVKQHRKLSGKVVTKITQETLKKSTGKSVAQILTAVSGITINGSQSNEGQNLGYYVRGGRNRQVVIILDGVQVSDGSQIANDFDLRLIPLQNIEQIEIVKGASSVLYGSGAATAVIQITTKKSSKKPLAASLSTTIGTNKTQKNKNYKAEAVTNAIHINGTIGKWFYATSFTNRYTNGLSAIAAPQGEAPFESDVFNHFDSHTTLGIQWSKNLKISRFFNVGKLKAGFDNFDFTDANHLSKTRQWRTGGNFEWNNNTTKFVINDSYTTIKRELFSNFPAQYDARLYAIDAYLQYRFGKSITAILGTNFTTSNMNAFTIPFGESQFSQVIAKQEARFHIVDPYVNMLYTSKAGLNLNMGARLNTHSVYNTKLVYHINPSYNFALSEKNFKLLTSYSTAYITPSLFQIFDPSFGNQELLPEENATFEAGLELTTKNHFSASILYFSRKEKNVVDFVTLDPVNFLAQYQNVEGKYHANGVEVALSKRITEKWNIQTNYTFTQPDPQFELRIPKHIIHAEIAFQPLPKTQISCNFQYYSKRQDLFFNPDNFQTERVTLKAYGLIDFFVSQQIMNELNVFARVENLFNENYQELYRYATRGRNLLVGLQLDF